MYVSAKPICTKCGKAILTDHWYINENGAQICIMCGTEIIAQETYKKASTESILNRGIRILIVLMLIFWGIVYIKSMIEPTEYASPITFKEHRGN